MKKVIDLIPRAVEQLIENNTVMIDVRREEEWQYTGVIKNAYKMTFFDAYGNHNIEAWMKEFEGLVTSKEQTFVLICAHANRTKTIGDFLIDQGYINTAHLYGGMALWAQEGRETIKHEA